MFSRLQLVLQRYLQISSFTMSRTTFNRILPRNGYVCPQCIPSLVLRRQGVRAFHKTRLRQSERQSVLSLLEERGYVHQIAGYECRNRVA